MHEGALQQRDGLENKKYYAVSLFLRAQTELKGSGAFFFLSADFVGLLNSKLKIEDPATLE